jgi:hypothetical protein
MSKPITRIVFAVLVSLAIIAAVAPSVQARLESIFQKTEASNAANTSISTDNQTLKEATAKEQVAPSQFDEFAPSESSHNCNSDPTVDY